MEYHGHGVLKQQRILDIMDEHSAPAMAHSRRHDANLCHKTSRNCEKWWVMTRGGWDGLVVIIWPIRNEDPHSSTHGPAHLITTLSISGLASLKTKLITSKTSIKGYLPSFYLRSQPLSICLQMLKYSRVWSDDGTNDGPAPDSTLVLSLPN